MLTDRFASLHDLVALAIAAIALAVYAAAIAVVAVTDYRQSFEAGREAVAGWLRQVRRPARHARRSWLPLSLAAAPTSHLGAGLSIAVLIALVAFAAVVVVRDRRRWQYNPRHGTELTRELLDNADREWEAMDATTGLIRIPRDESGNPLVSALGWAPAPRTSEEDGASR